MSVRPAYRPKGTGHIKDGQYKRDSFTPEEIFKMVTDAGKAVGYKHPVPNGYLAKRDMCFIAMLALFGKRAIEVCSVRRADVRIDQKENRILVKFLVRKKKKPLTVVKPKSLMNPLTKYILDYLDLTNKLYPKNEWLFPSPKSSNKHLTSWRLLQIIKGINKDAWPHWFRHTLADAMVTKGHRDLQELVEWFDWDSQRGIVEASRYVKAGAGGRVREMGEEDYYNVE